jgi:hypothetical protein
MVKNLAADAATIFSFRQKTKTTTQTNRFGAAGPVK